MSGDFKEVSLVISRRFSGDLEEVSLGISRRLVW